MTYFNIDVHEMKITTSSPDAQIWFNRGLVWCFAYNHEEAVSCFKKALEFDANCAMAHWGVAFASGPNYNFQWVHMPPEMKASVLAACFDASNAALENSKDISDYELDLIQALSRRYPQRETISDMNQWHEDFSVAMREVHEKHGDNLDVVSIFAEAIMNCTPWKLWDLKTGKPAEGAGTLEAREVLERALDNNEKAWSHPGILHLYVHLMEMSPFPELALKAGDALSKLVPDAGHLIHMPSHIDVLCGHYHNVLVRNQAAIEADNKFLEHAGPVNFYSLYRCHNYHFAIYGAMFLGQYEPAMKAAQELIDTVPDELLRSPLGDFLESYISMKQHVMVRFGKWRELIKQEEPEDKELFCVTTAMMRYAKAVAHSAIGEVEEAEAMKTLFLEAKAEVPPTRLLHNNTCVDLLEIAEEMLNGELEYRKNNFDLAFEHLRHTVDLEDSLPYDEPWGWIQPSRHALGALLSEQGRFAEAEKAYREDLGMAGTLSRASIHPDNIWSLRGLYDCLVKRGESVESRMIKQRLDLAAARSDLKVNASCFCAQKAMTCCSGKNSEENLKIL